MFVQCRVQLSLLFWGFSVHAGRWELPSDEMLMSMANVSFSRQCLYALSGVPYFLIQTPSVASSGPLVQRTSVFPNDSVTEARSLPRIRAGSGLDHRLATKTFWCTWLFETYISDMLLWFLDILWRQTRINTPPSQLRHKEENQTGVQWPCNCYNC